MERLLSKRALVTGASGGIGRGIAEAFAREGATVTVAGRDPERTEACRDAILASGASAHAAVRAAPVHEYPLAMWDKLLAVNLTAAFVISKAAIPHMLEAGGGAFLHISSVCSITIWDGVDVAYSVAKAGLNTLSEQIAVEYAQRGIRSNALLPGLISVPSNKPTESSEEELVRAIVARHPAGRIGEVEEVAQAAVFLCSDESLFLTGANVPIDGAYSRV